MTERTRRAIRAVAVPALAFTTVTVCRSANGRAGTSSEGATPIVEIKAGREIPVRLDRGLRLEENRLGEPVSLTVTSPIRVDGGVAIPPGSVISGRVRDIVREGARRTREAAARLLFDGIEVRDELYPIRVSDVDIERSAINGEGSRGEQRTALTSMGGEPGFVPAGTVFTVRLRESLQIDRGG